MDKLNKLNEESLKTDVPLPVYYQLKQLLKKHIMEGLWKIEERIPTERELCEIFHVSRITVIRAVNELVNEGLLYRFQGKGTFVAKPKLKEQYVQQSIGFYQEMTSKGLHVGTKVLEQVVIIAPEDIRSELRLDAVDKVIKIERLRSLEGELILLDVNYIPFDICPDLAEDDLNDTSLYSVLKKKYGLEAGTGNRTIEISFASDSDAQILEIPKGSPMLLVKGVGYLADGRPLECFETKHRGDRVKFEVKAVHLLV